MKDYMKNYTQLFFTLLIIPTLIFPYNTPSANEDNLKMVTNSKQISWWQKHKKSILAIGVAVGTMTSGLLALKYRHSIVSLFFNPVDNPIKKTEPKSTQPLQSSNSLSIHQEDPFSFSEWLEKCKTLAADKTFLTSELVIKQTQKFIDTMSQQLQNSNWLHNNLPSFLNITSDPEHPKSINGAYVQKLTLYPGARVGIHGDFHGDIQSLNDFVQTWINEGYIDNSLAIIDPNFYILLLGDYVDRGSHGLEVQHLVYQLKIINPDKVFLARGNHEDFLTQSQYGFYSELFKKFNSDCDVAVPVMSHLSFTYDFLPLCIYVTSPDIIDTIQCCHGGFELGHNPHELLDQENVTHEFVSTLHKDKVLSELRLSDIRKKLSDNLEQTNLSSDNGWMWSDFDPKKYSETVQTTRGTENALEIGEIPTKEILAAYSNNRHAFRMVIRAHQHSNKKMNDRILNRDGLSHPDDRGIGKLWIDDLPIHKQEAERLDDVPVITFSVSPRVACYKDYKNEDVFGLLTIAPKYEDWRLKAYHVKNESTTIE